MEEEATTDMFGAIARSILVLRVKPGSTKMSSHQDASGATSRPQSTQAIWPRLGPPDHAAATTRV
jgi:hypothetical protein